MITNFETNKVYLAETNTGFSDGNNKKEKAK